MTKPKTTWACALSEAGCYSFLEPLASRAVDRAMELSADAASLASADSLDDLRALCLARLALVYERPVLQLAIQRAGLFGLVALDAKDGEAARMMSEIAWGVREELATDGGASLRARLPQAADYERVVAENFAEAIAEFFGRLHSKRDDVSQKLLGGRAIERVTGLSAGNADSHRHGRMVMRVVSDAGSFYYKPHDCRLDALYLELVRTWFADCARAADLVAGKGYAFAEQLVPQELSCEEDLRTYWRNFGRLAALFYCLGSRDMTCDNIMCCGQLPAALDLEALLVGNAGLDARAAVPKGNAALESVPPALLADSVFTTSVLPMRLSGKTVSPLLADNASGTCLPRLHGEQRTVKGFEQDFCEGFEDGYRRLARHREEVLALLQRYADATCRQILISTQPYYRARALLFSPQAMTDRRKRDEALEALNAHYDVFPATLGQALAAPDAAALGEGDIPYYCSRAAERMLYAGDNRAVGVLLKQSALELATSRLERLSEDDLHFELDLIRRCLIADAPALSSPTA